ncbi:hypothetical protein N9Z27_01990 [Alphaproteobacteria bacterium]|nr:hypothetical protein [Alphaproteobacteria bacterium]
MIGALTGIFINCIRALAGKAPEVLFGFVLGSYYKHAQYRKKLKDIANQSFRDHKAVTYITDYFPSKTEPGAVNQRIEAIRSQTFEEMFPDSYPIIAKVIDQAAERGRETGNPNMLPLIKEILIEQEADPDIIDTIEDDWKNGYSLFLSQNPDIAAKLGAFDENGELRVYPILTMCREGAERFRVLMVTQHQLEDGYLPHPDNVRYQTSRGYEDDDVSETHSRLATYEYIVADLNRSENKLFPEWVYVTATQSPQQQQANAKSNPENRASPPIHDTKPTQELSHAFNHDDEPEPQILSFASSQRAIREAVFEDWPPPQAPLHSPDIAA